MKTNKKHNLTESIEILVSRTLNNRWFNHTYGLNISKDDLGDLLGVATKGQLFQLNGILYEQIDGVAMGIPLRPFPTNVFMSSIEKKLEL